MHAIWLALHANPPESLDDMRLGLYHAIHELMHANARQTHE